MTLWMRWLDFRALRDLLLLADAHPDGLRANELTALATSERVLLRRDGRPYAPSMHYHHRRTLERLGLLQKRGGRFTASRDHPDVSALTTRTELLAGLIPAEKAAFANALVQNKDCHTVFFGNFLPGREPAHNAATFVDTAHAAEIAARPQHGREADDYTSGCRVTTHASQGVAIRPATADKWNILEGAAAVQAIHFGLRSWCVDQLEFLDIACKADGTYTAYPKHIVPRLADQDLAATMFASLDFPGDWMTIRIPDCVLATGIQQRASIEQALGVLHGWLTLHPDIVCGVPTRVGFITAGLPASQHDLALRTYLRTRGGAYLSHLRIHQKLKHHIQNGASSP